MSIHQLHRNQLSPCRLRHPVRALLIMAFTVTLLDGCAGSTNSDTQTASRVMAHANNRTDALAAATEKARRQCRASQSDARLLTTDVDAPNGPAGQDLNAKRQATNTIGELAASSQEGEHYRARVLFNCR